MKVKYEGSGNSNYTVRNVTSGLAGYNQTTTFIYQSEIVEPSSGTALASLQQMFCFSDVPFSAPLGGGVNHTVSVPAGAIKWTLVINASIPVGSGLNISYLLVSMVLDNSTLTSSNSTTNGSSVVMVVKSESTVLGTTTEGNITATTYYLLLSTQEEQAQQDAPVALVQVLDVAAVDGQLIKINHWMTPSIKSQSVEYVLGLSFPAFNRTVEYDPILSMGTLVQGSDGGKGGTNIGLIVGATVGITSGVIVVAGVILIATALSIYAKRKPRRCRLGGFVVGVGFVVQLRGRR